MLKKIVIAISFLLFLSVAAAGVEAYRLYSGLQGIIVPVNRIPLCPTGTPPASRIDPPTPRVTPTALASSRLQKVKPHPTSQPCEYSPTGPAPTLGGKQQINILLLGSDNDKKRIPLLSQTIMVVTIDPVHKKVSILSIPRDFWVYIPGISTLGDPTTYHKIDAALSEGAAASGSSNSLTRFKAGVALARATVEDDFSIRIDHYAWVGLTGFINVIDTLGGVIIDAQHPIVDDSYPDDLNGGNPFAFTRVYIPAGPQFMGGTTALEYVRSRHADLVGDFGRGARQEQMLLAIRQKADSLGITDIGTINSLVSDLQGWVRSDVPLDQLQPMIDFGRTLKPSSIRRVVLSPPLYSNIGTAYDGESIVNPNWPAIMPVIHKMFAPPISKHHHTNHPGRHRLKLTHRLAEKLFTRISGAAPLPRKLPAAKLPPNAVQGRIFFTDAGNIQSYNGKNFFRITHSYGISDLALTPNATTLAYARRWSPVISDIFVKDRHGGRTSQITQDNTNDGNVGDDVWAYEPAISPDGKTIIYASDAYKLTANATGFIDLALYRYDLASRTNTQITNPAEGAGGDTDPRFDPVDSNKLLYTRFYYLGNSAVASRLMLLNLTTDTALGLTPFAQRTSQGAWQPNGHHIAYVEATGQGTTLFDAPFFDGKLRTGRAKVVASGMVSEPAFSPDGKHIAFYKQVGDGFQMWEINLKNGWPTGRPFELFSQPGLVASSPIVWTR